ncbi:response regulator [Oceanobacillus bengalensis]|uniref:Response regulator n=1 Tax=Oceanobacillus bengalensis TaxID=1435466 RepID=A0A494YYY7_9BACI|nr:response regulator [Oceanobacillus bengalensis]RKQ15386.1 response regulator [Oceanobacillus bengalensis]
MGKGILVVDDQLGIRLLLTDILENEGYQVHTATNGKEALDQIHIKSYDLIILDYKLPIIDGAKVLQQLEVEKTQVPAIIMSGLAENIIGVKEEYTFVKAVIGKPFDVKVLCKQIKAILP